MTVITTTHWPLLLDKTQEEAQAILEARQAASVAIAGEDYRVEIERYFEAASRTLVVRRAWPDQAAADAWIAYALNEGAVSAVTDPQ